MTYGIQQMVLSPKTKADGNGLILNCGASTIMKGVVTSNSSLFDGFT